MGADALIRPSLQEDSPSNSPRFPSASKPNEHPKGSLRTPPGRAAPTSGIPAAEHPEGAAVDSGAAVAEPRPTTNLAHRPVTRPEGRGRRPPQRSEGTAEPRVRAAGQTPRIPPRSAHRPRSAARPREPLPRIAGPGSPPGPRRPPRAAERAPTVHAAPPARAACRARGPGQPPQRAAAARDRQARTSQAARPADLNRGKL